MSNQKIAISFKTWERDSYGLFDFEAKNVISQKLILESSKFLVRQNLEIKAVEEEEQSSNENTENELLIKVVKTRGEISKIDGSYLLKNLSLEENCRIWQVLRIRGNYKKESILRDGDFFRLGRITFKIIKVKLINFR